MRINFGEISTSHGTRKKGLEWRIQIENSIRNNSFVTFNFENVDVVSHSFADECFAKLLLTFDLETIKKNTTFVNANDLVMKTIAFTIKERLPIHA